MAKDTETRSDPDMLAGMEGLIVAIEQPREVAGTDASESGLTSTPPTYDEGDDPLAAVGRPSADVAVELGEADTLWTSRASATPGDAVDSVEQARAYDTIFRRAAAPRQMGRYVVLDSLGQGGMGVVLRAYDRELDRTVALKVLHREIDRQHAQRLRREAQAMAKLSHPNVVQVYEVGEIEGQTFVAMELVKGQTVQQWMDQRPRPGWRACVELFVQLGAGLLAAHEQGLVHRDFKPGNAIVDDRGRARVLDFGLARRDDEVDHEPSVMIEKARTDSHAAVPLEGSLTATGAVLGTPAYMPPEQMGGLEADARSDQFSFCVSLYEALYGERPYEGCSMMAIMVSMRSGAVRPAPKGSDVPAALRRVLLQGLSVVPAERWPSMEALLEQLRRIVAPRRWRWMAVALGVGLVAVGGGLGATQTLAWLNRCTGARKQLEGAWDDARRQEVKAAILGTGLSYAPGTWERVEPRLDAYADAWATEHTETCEATRSRDEQSEEEMSLRMGCLRERRQHLRATVNELAHADATVVENAVQAVTSLPGLERCRDLEALRAEVPPPEDPEAAEQVAALHERVVEAKAKEEAGKYADGLRLADEVVEKGATLSYEPLMARAWLQQGELRWRMGDYEGAAAALRQAYGAAVARRMTVEAAAASTELVHVLGFLLVRHEEGRGWAEHADALSRAVGTDEAIVEYLHNLAVVAARHGDHEEARKALERALAVRETALGPDHPEVADALEQLGWVVSWQGKHEQAREAYERALAIREKALGPDHPSVAGSYYGLGLVAGSQGKHEQAREAYERALAIYEKALDPDHPDLAAPHLGLGKVAESQGKHEQARESYERALAIREKALGPDHPYVGELVERLGVLAESQGEYEEAYESFVRVVAIFEKALGPDNPAMAFPVDELGRVASLQGKHEQARDLYERALAIQEKALGPDHPDVARSLTRLGDELLALAKPVDALAPLERALTIGTDEQGDPALLAQTQSALARALWSAPKDRGGDRPRARTLAEQARDTYAAAGEAKQTELAEVQTWLAEHHLP